MISNEPQSDRPGEPKGRSASHEPDGGRLKEHMQSVAHDAREKGRSVLEKQKHQMAETLRHVCEALHSASKKLHDEHDDTVADYTEALSERLDDTADYVDRMDISDVIDNVENFARRQPHVFLGGMFLFGLATARFLKASPPHSSHTSHVDKMNRPSPMGQSMSRSMGGPGGEPRTGSSQYPSSQGPSMGRSTPSTGASPSMKPPTSDTSSSSSRDTPIRAQSTSSDTGIGGLEHSPRNDPSKPGNKLSGSEPQREKGKHEVDR